MQTTLVRSSPGSQASAARACTVTLSMERLASLSSTSSQVVSRGEKISSAYALSSCPLKFPPAVAAGKKSESRPRGPHCHRCPRCRTPLHPPTPSTSCVMGGALPPSSLALRTGFRRAGMDSNPALSRAAKPSSAISILDVLVVELLLILAKIADSVNLLCDHDGLLLALLGNRLCPVEA